MAIGVLGILICAYLLYRLNAVYKFRDRILKDFPFRAYENLPSYGKMVLSVKSITLKNYLRL